MKHVHEATSLCYQEVIQADSHNLIQDKHGKGDLLLGFRPFQAQLPVPGAGFSTGTVGVLPTLCPAGHCVWFRYICNTYCSWWRIIPAAKIISASVMKADEGGVSWGILLELEISQGSNDHEVGLPHCFHTWCQIFGFAFASEWAAAKILLIISFYFCKDHP